MMTTISKTFDFDAAHRLDRLPADHKCSRMHGHTYRVELILCGSPDATTGFVVDYEIIAAAWKLLHDQLDHRTLNDVDGLDVPTTENVAAWIWARIRIIAGVGDLLTAVRVYESSTTWAEVRG